MNRQVNKFNTILFVFIFGFLASLFFTKTTKKEFVIKQTSFDSTLKIIQKIIYVNGFHHKGVFFIVNEDKTVTYYDNYTDVKFISVDSVGLKNITWGVVDGGMICYKHPPYISKEEEELIRKIRWKKK